MTDYLLDTSAWIEYFDGTSAGKKVEKLLNDKRNTCFVCRLILCEIMSKLVRNGFEPEEYYDMIKAFTRTIDETDLDYFNTGIRHAVLKKQENRISYTDALLVVFSETRKLTIVSKDEHLKKHNTYFLK